MSKDNLFQSTKFTHPFYKLNGWIVKCEGLDFFLQTSALASKKYNYLMIVIVEIAINPAVEQPDLALGQILMKFQFCVGLSKIETSLTTPP